jgi:hypothetical protein
MQQNMPPTNDRDKTLIEIIRTFSPEKISGVVDFVDFFSHLVIKHLGRIRDNDRSLLTTALQDILGK